MPLISDPTRSCGPKTILMAIHYKKGLDSIFFTQQDLNLALEFAFQNMLIDKIPILVKLGANINETTTKFLLEYDSVSLLCFAVIKGDSKLVATALACGAVIKLDENDPFPLLYYLRHIPKTVSCEEIITILKLLLTACPSLSFNELFGYVLMDFPLALAVNSDHLPLVQALLVTSREFRKPLLPDEKSLSTRADISLTACFADRISASILQHLAKIKTMADFPERLSFEKNLLQNFWQCDDNPINFLLFAIQNGWRLTVRELLNLHPEWLNVKIAGITLVDHAIQLALIHPYESRLYLPLVCEFTKRGADLSLRPTEESMTPKDKLDAVSTDVWNKHIPLDMPIYTATLFARLRTKLATETKDARREKKSQHLIKQLRTYKDDEINQWLPAAQHFKSFLSTPNINSNRFFRVLSFQTSHIHFTILVTCVCIAKRLIQDVSESNKTRLDRLFILKIFSFLNLAELFERPLLLAEKEREDFDKYVAGPMAQRALTRVL